MSRKYKFNDNDQLNFVSFAVVNWMDLFIRKEYRDIVVNSLKYCIANKDAAGAGMREWICVLASCA